MSSAKLQVILLTFIFISMQMAFISAIPFKYNGYKSCTPREFPPRNECDDGRTPTDEELEKFCDTNPRRVYRIEACKSFIKRHGGDTGPFQSFTFEPYCFTLSQYCTLTKPPTTPTTTPKPKAGNGYKSCNSVELLPRYECEDGRAPTDEELEKFCDINPERTYRIEACKKIVKDHGNRSGSFGRFNRISFCVVLAQYCKLTKPSTTTPKPN
ncbi:uncharacterized protein LOC107365093 [Tetranychus urticae]|uniref:uncharacterized protein LOC107365093 n=1 Tax=Tetranychus urticae TaxID=32264 RepID=UPI00077BCF7A|nr:uncharacterized protein LOC107365093 [Tetranychus urticae]